MKRRLLSLLLIIVLVLSLASAVYADSGLPNVTRLAGKDRIQTAFQVADQLKKELAVVKFDNMIVASGATFADALPGSYLSAVKNAPILLTLAKQKYIDQTADYIKANLKDGGTVYILGGESAVPPLMEQALPGLNVKRVAGKDRFGTNLEILKEAGVKPGDEILVCTAKEFADSLSAAATGKPILLVYKKITNEQKEYLATLSGNSFCVVGGTSAVPETISGELEKYGSVSRLAGKNRMDTSVLVAKNFFPDAQLAVVAYGWDFPDGLCGGSLAYATKSPLILTIATKEETAAKYVAESGITGGYALGGTVVLPEETVRKIFPVIEVPEPTECAHKYDNACDKDCNLCGAVRTPAEHVYDDAYDGDCNVCGMTRTPAVKPLQITLQPQSQVADRLETISFSVKVSGGTEPYSYQWQYIHNGIQDWLDITDWGTGNRTDTITITVQSMDHEGGGKYRCVITDAGGRSVTSGEAGVVVPLKITTQPESAIADYGEKASFSVAVAGGMTPLNYQWQGTYTGDPDGWSDLGSESWVQGSNDFRFYVTASETLIAENWRFRCVIRDSFGQELITDTVSVLEDNSFGIKKQPENVEIATMGDTITFTVEASGENLSYRWYSGYYAEDALEFTAKALSSDTYSGINSDTLSFMLTEKTLKLEYFCHIYDSEGNQTGTKSVKVLDVIRTLAIRTQPVNAPVVYSDDTPVTFTVEAVGEGLTYQWYRCYHDEKPEEDSSPNPVNYTHASGAKTNTLTCNAGPIDKNDGYGVYCKITDKYGSVVYTDLVFSNVNAIYFAINSPADAKNAVVGNTVSFTARTYGGKGPNTYQWQYLEDGVWVNYNSTVGTDVILTITVTEKDFARKIRCIVTDSLGNQITSKEVIVVPAELTIIAQPKDVRAELDEQISFSVKVAGGKETYTYQWQYKVRTDTVWKNISGGTQSTMTYWVQKNRYHNEYRCVITDAEGNQVISRTVRLDPVDLTILTQPVTQTGKKGDILSYTVEVAGGKAPYTYQWYYRIETGQWIKSTKSSATYTFEVNMVTVTQNHSFYCVITDADGEKVTTNTVYFQKP